MAQEPPNMPSSGSLFIFDRKVLRYFRKDGHNWRKKKDGKTVKEAHERLKAGRINVLNCNYALGEDNEDFQRRVYWSLEEELSHIAFVHYREVKGNRTNFNRIKETEEAVPYSQETEPNSEMDSSVLSSFLPNNYQVTSQSTDAAGLNSAQALEHVDTESDDYQGNFSTISGMDFASLTQADKAKDSNNAGLEILDFSSWADDLGNATSGNQAVTSQPSFPETQPDTNGVLPEQEDPILWDLFNSNLEETLEFGNLPQIQNECQGNMTNFKLIKETEEAVPYSQENEPNSEMDSSVLSCFLLNNYKVTSQSTDTTGLNSAQALEHVDTESAGNHQASSGFHPFFKLQQPVVEKFNAGLTDTSFPGPISDDYQGNFSTISGVDFASLTQADRVKDINNAVLEILDFSSRVDDLGNGTSGNQAVTSQPSLPETQPDTNGSSSTYNQQYGYPPQTPYHQPSSYNYTPQHQHGPPPPSSSYGSQASYDYGSQIPVAQLDRKLCRKYVRIANKCCSLDEVTAALASAGLESSNLIVGIDFTKSNEWTGARSFNRRSLHHIGNGQNPYEQAISIIGKTLSAFDKDNLILCYGFGDASTHDRDVFSFYPDESACNGFEEVLTQYKEIVPSLRLAGPTSFAPIIEMAITTVEQSSGQYHVLLIIADGQVTRSVDTQRGQLSLQEQKTINAIVQASEYPLSIILVGVGDGPWDMMRGFDDNIPARAFDNFQFINFTEIMSKNVGPARKETEFALAALMKIPSQYKATIELGLLGRQRGNAPERVPLPPPLYYVNSSSYSKTQRSSPSSSSPYENQLCTICLTNAKNMAFGCGHQFCCECGEDLEVCPICRRAIETRIRLY